MVASDRLKSAALAYRDFGVAAKERDRLAARSEQLNLEASNLEISSPVSGVVLTSRPQDRVGSSVAEGTELFEIADPTRLVASIQVSEYDMYTVHLGSWARLQVEAVTGTIDSYVQSITPISSVEPSEQTKYMGLRPPQFYLVRLGIAADSLQLRPGMRGVARIYGKRRSLAALGLEELRVILSRKIW